MFEKIVTVVGFASAAALIVGLIAGHRVPRWRIWPAPPANSIQSFTVWTLFRALNISVLIVCTAHCGRAIANGEAGPLQVLLMALAVAFFAAYLWTLWSLGHQATYCRASGLTQEGVYAWSRNPQYATAIAAYSALGLATASLAAAALAAAMVAVYALMAIAEEPWLQSAYGESYRQYCARVPRFFHTRRLVTEVAKRLHVRSASVKHDMLPLAHRLRRPRS